MSSMLSKIFRRSFTTFNYRLRYIRVLGIETSCDDTGVAAVDSEKNILGEALYSQSQIHTLHGGILPHIAENIHTKSLPLALDDVLQQSNLEIKDFDAIAVTNRPGLLICLKTGIEFAKHLSLLHSVPLIPIHHMEAHALTVTLFEDVKFPFLSLLISGRHCILVFVESATKFLSLSNQSDIGIGSVLDKMSRRLKLKNLPGFTTMQGGPAIETLAKTGNPLALNFSDIRKKRDCTFYFAGIKAKFEKFVEIAEEKSCTEGAQLLPNVADICASFQFSITKILCHSLENGMRYLEAKNLFADKEKVLVMSGGVASNEFIRKMMKHVCDEYGYKFLAPTGKYCTDNGVMIAWNGIERLKENVATVRPSDFDQIEVLQKSPFEEVAIDLSKVIKKKRYVNIRDFLDKNAEELEDFKCLEKDKNSV